MRGQSALLRPTTGHRAARFCSEPSAHPPSAPCPPGLCAARSVAAIRSRQNSPYDVSGLSLLSTGWPSVRGVGGPRHRWLSASSAIPMRPNASPSPPPATLSRSLGCRRRPRRPRAGPLRILRYPPDRCLACQQTLSQEPLPLQGNLTVYTPKAVVVINYRVCSLCARTLDARADAPRLLRRLAAWYVRSLPPQGRSDNDNPTLEQS